MSFILSSHSAFFYSDFILMEAPIGAERATYTSRLYHANGGGWWDFFSYNWHKNPPGVGILIELTWFVGLYLN